MVQQQEKQIVQSRLNLEEFLPGFAPPGIRVQPSFQAPPLPGRGVQRRDVFLAPGAALRGPPLAGRRQPLHDSAPCRARHAGAGSPGSGRGGGFEPEAGAQPRRLDVGAVAGLLHPGPRRVVWLTPTVFVVEGVAERVERPPPPRRGDVEAPPGLDVTPRGEDVDLSATVALAMQHGRPCVSVRIPAPPYSSSGSSIGCGCSRDARVAFLRGCGMPSGVQARHVACRADWATRSLLDSGASTSGDRISVRGARGAPWPWPAGGFGTACVTRPEAG